MTSALHAIVRIACFSFFMAVLATGFTVSASSDAFAAKDKTYKCGAKGEKVCPLAKKATYIGKAMTKCPKGNFFDLKTFSCWSCPKSYKRTIFDIKKGKACEQRPKTSYEKAEKKRKVKVGKKGCKKGEFWDKKGGSLGACWKCPKGFKRGVAKVDGGKACIKITKFKYSKATKYGKFTPCKKGFFDPRSKGQCWSCPGGYWRGPTKVTSKSACIINATYVCDKGNIGVRGKCYKKNECGKKGQRPCLIVERIPSCNKGLMEEIVSNTCLKPKMASCLMGVGAMRAVVKGGGAASKAQQKVMKFLINGSKKALKDLVGKKIYNKIDSSGKSAKKKLQKQVKKLGIKKLLKSQIKVLSGAAGELNKIKTAAARNKSKIQKLFTSNKLCTESLNSTFTTLKGYLGNPNANNLIKASLDPHPWYDGLIIKRANAAALGTKIWAGSKAFFYIGFDIAVDKYGMEVGFTPYMITDFKTGAALRLGMSLGVTTDSSAAGGISKTIEAGMVVADKLSDFYGAGLAFSIGALEEIFNSKVMKETTYLQLGLTMTTTMPGLGPFRLNGVLFPVSLDTKKDAPSINPVAISVGTGYDIPLIATVNGKARFGK